MSSRFKLHISLFAVLLTVSMLAACAPPPPPTPFIPPRADTPTRPPAIGATPNIPTLTPSPEPIASPTSTPPCTDGLAFVQDVTIPDGTVVSPGASVDKQWLVQNNGTCNWDARYRLKFVGGQEMGAAPEQALYPARAGMQATLRVTFTAPTEPGTYQSAWQAISSDGTPFGDPVFIEIVVE